LNPVLEWVRDEAPNGLGIDLTTRRELKLHSLGNIREELQRLTAGPVETTGSWTYYQIITHCRYPFIAAWNGPLGEGHTPDAAKLEMLAKLVERGFMRPDLPIILPESAVEGLRGDVRAAESLLREAMDRFERYEGPNSLHPFFGKLTKEEWTKFLVVHTAHHLGYVRLKES
jgi:hypothetical protein